MKGPADLTDDAFLGGALHVLQPAEGYRAGLDAVLLAAAVPIALGVGCDVLDAGAGVGTVGLCVARRLPDTRLMLIERQPVLAALARSNAERNRLSGRVTVVEADLTLGGAVAQGPRGNPDLAPARFDHLLANPPYRVAGTGTTAQGLKGMAHQLAAGDLDRWLAALATLARADASLTIVHEALALGEVLAALDGRFGGVCVLPVHPRAGAPAHRILVQARKGSRAPLALLAGLVLHGEGSAFTPAVEAILRHGASLDIGVR